VPNQSTCEIVPISYDVLLSLQCFDAVGWATGRASDLLKN